MNRLFNIIFFVSVIACGSAHESRFRNFVNSFEVYTSSEPFKFGKVVQYANEMSESEALEFVYHGDSSRLYCAEKSINMENERDFRIVISKHYPQKCFRIARRKYDVIGMTEFDCNNFVWQNLKLKIVDAHDKVRDSLLVRRANDYDYVTNGMMNPENMRIFLVKLNKQTRDTFIYDIDEQTLTFRQVKSDLDNPFVEDDMMSTLERSGLITNFMQ